MNNPPPGDLEESYERVFRSLLWRLRLRNLERGVRRLIRAARAASATDIADALAEVHTEARRRVIRRLVQGRRTHHDRNGAAAATANERVGEQTRLALESSVAAEPVGDSPDFHCDSGLGGLARWLRAAGYDARFWPQIDDDDLVRQTARSNAILLTTDGPLMKRSAIVWGAVPALLVPLAVGKHEQFRYVAARLGLPRKASRCMSCGGALQSVDKQSVRERIPPRTYPWRDDYFQCRRCGKLFWHGTHWHHVEKRLENITQRLEKLESAVKKLIQDDEKGDEDER